MALVIREMSTTYGRSPMGYLWAILEPVAGILLLTFIFGLALRTPPIGTNFPLFYASGMLPFLAYNDLQNKISVSLRFNKSLLQYPRVTFLDAIFARLLLNLMTQAMVAIVILSFIIWYYRLDLLIEVPRLLLAYAMVAVLSLGIGTMNCYLFTTYPVLERFWAILTRPLFIVSCIFFMFDGVPQPYRDWLWWNPLIHLVGMMRSGMYATYDATYVSVLYVMGLGLVLFMTGLLLLRRYHKDLANNL